MPSLLDSLPQGARVSAIRLRSLGDCVLTTPALALLKAYRRDLQVQIIVEPRFAGVFEGNPDVDDISSDVRIFRGSVNRRRADLVLNFHGGTRSMMMTAASGARIRTGFGHHRYSFLYSHKIPRAQEILGIERPVHTAEHLASAMFWLGVPRREIPRAKLAAGSPPNDLGAYAVLHPFALFPEKVWPAERFVEVARHLRDDNGLKPVFLAGPADDTSAFRQFRVMQNAPLADVKSLMAGAALFIGNDSGPAHVAAAFGIPVVVLFGPSDPVTWAPWRTESQVLTSRDGIARIQISDVVAATEVLLASREKKVSV
jgi:lipopolysaccharide heptosyltransferase III